MTKFKRGLLIALSILLIFTMACGRTTPPDKDGDEEKPPGDKTEGDEKDETQKGEIEEGEILFWTLSLSPTFDDYINGVISDFEDEYSGVKVKWQDLPYDQAEQQTLAAASGGNLADVINLNTDFLKKLGALGALQDMDEAASDVKDKYFEGAWDAGTVNGVAYALPWYLSNGVLLYNKEILEEAGYDKAPTTEEEAWEMSKDIHEKTGAYGNTVSNLHIDFPANGIPLVSEDGKKATVNTPEALERIEFFKEKYDEGLIPDEIVLEQANMPEWYAQEKLAWWGTGPQLFRQVEDLSPEVYEKSDAAPAILGSLGKSSMAAMNVAVSAKSKYPNAAVEFAKFITNDENQLEFCKIVAILPSTKEAASDEFFTQGEDSDDPAEKGKFFSAQQLENAVDFFVPAENVTQINKALNDEFHKVLLEDKDPQTALDDAEAKINELLK